MPFADYNDGETSAEYDYDDMGRKTWKKINYGPFSKKYSYSYYGNGLKHTFTAPNGTVYTYNYGLNNELQDIQIPSVGTISIPDYIWNRPATINYPGGTQRSYTYNALMRLESLVANAPDNTPILNYGYPLYDEVGNILTKVTEHDEYGYSDSYNAFYTGSGMALYKLTRFDSTEFFHQKLLTELPSEPMVIPSRIDWRYKNLRGGGVWQQQQSPQISILIMIVPGKRC